MSAKGPKTSRAPWIIVGILVLCVGMLAIELGPSLHERLGLFRMDRSTEHSTQLACRHAVLLGEKETLLVGARASGDRLRGHRAGVWGVASLRTVGHLLPSRNRREPDPR